MRDALKPVLMDEALRIFLKHVGTVIKSNGGIDFFHLDKLWNHPQFAGRHLPKTGLFCANFSGGGIGQLLLQDRHLCGQDMRDLIFNTTVEMQRMLHSVIELPGPFCEVIVLWGGLAQLLYGVKPSIFGEAMEDSCDVVNTVFVRKKRKKDPTKFRGWDVKHTIVIEEWFPCPTYLIMEECIASGNSVISVIHDMEAALKPQNALPKYIVLTPVCASLEGVEAIYKVTEELGIQLIVVFNSAIIQISEEGVDPELPFTDLPLNDLTIVSERFFRTLASRYQEKRICFVGDMGRSVHKPTHYLFEYLCDMVELGMDPHKEDWTKFDLRILCSPEFVNLISQNPKHFAFYREIVPLLDELKNLHWQKGRKHFPPKMLEKFPCLKGIMSPEEILGK